MLQCYNLQSNNYQSVNNQLPISLEDNSDIWWLITLNILDRLIIVYYLSKQILSYNNHVYF